MSKAVASAGTSAGSATNTNVAAGSMNRRISHAQAVRSTCMSVLVAHFIAVGLLSEARQRLDRRLRPSPCRHPKIVARLDPPELRAHLAQGSPPFQGRRGCGRLRLCNERFVFLRGGVGQAERPALILRPGRRPRGPDTRL